MYANECAENRQERMETKFASFVHTTLAIDEPTACHLIDVCFVLSKMSMQMEWHSRNQIDDGIVFYIF